MSGQITRKEIIEDEALVWGKEYAKQMQIAIDKNKEFVSVILALKDANDKLRNSPNVKTYNEALQKTNQLGQQAITVWKEQDNAEKALISTKRKLELATESTNQALIKERTVLNETNAEIKKQIIANGALESAYKKLSAQVTLSGDRLKNIISTGKLASESQNQYNVRLAIAQKEFDKLNVKVRSADAAVGQFNRNVGNYPKQAAEGLRNLISAFGVVTGIQLFASVMKDAFNQVRDFEKEVVNLGAIAQKSRAEIAPLEARIREVSKSSINGATDVAKLATELVKLGSTTEEAEQLLEPINNLSIALQASAEDSATLVKSLLNAYGEGATEAGRFTDVLAEAANRSALDFAGLRDSFSYIAPASRALGISVERTAAIIGTLADNGIRAESAGRLTSTAFARLAKQGLTLEDALQQINDAQEKGQSNLQVLALATELFGAEAGKIGLILANNTAKIDESTIAYQNSEGALKELTNKQLNSLDSQLKILSSSWEDYILDTNEATGASAALSSGVGFVAKNLKTILSILIIATGILVAYRAAVLLANLQTRLVALASTQAAIGQTANASATTFATAAWQRFNVALKANVLGLVAAALIAVIYLFDSFTRSMSEVSNEVKGNTDAFLTNRNEMAKSAQSTKTLTSRYEELQDKAKKLGGETKLSAAEQKEMQRIVSELAKVVPGAVTEVNKYGEALKLNTDLLKKYNVENAKILEIDKKKAIKDEINLQKELSEEIKNKTKNLKNFKEAEGQGSITTEFVVEKERELSVMKIDLILSQGRLKAINGITEAEREAIKVSDQKSASVQVAGKRTIEIIDAEIKAQQDLVSGLSDKSGKEGNAIKAKIAALEAERNLIFNTDKADKKATEDRLKRIKDVNDALFQLSQFRYENEISVNQKIIDSDKSTTDQKIESLNLITQLRTSKNNEALEKELLDNALSKEGVENYNKQKLDSYIKYSKDRATQILEGKIPTEKLTNEEKLIYEKYFANVKVLRDKDAEDTQKIIDAEVEAIQKRTDAELQLRTNQQNKDIVGENNRYADELEAAGENFKLIEAAREEHERRILAIQKKYALEAIQLQIDSLQSTLNDNDAKDASEQISAEKRADIVAKLEQFKREASDLTTESYAENAKITVEQQQELNEKLIDLGLSLKEALTDLTNAIFDARISNIDAEIERNNEYYDGEIEKAGENERQKKLLEIERDKKNAELEKKRKKEAYKAAVFNKVMALAEIAINTAIAISKVTAQAGVAAPFLIPGIIAMGVIQAATVLATPLPKYKHGRKDGPDEFAVVGDGGRREVVSDPDGSNPEVTPNKPTVMFLRRKQKVHRSVEDYKKYMRDSFLSDVEVNHQKAKEFHANISVNNDNSDLLEEMKLTRRAFENMKFPKPVNNKPQDINHQLWKFKNTNW